MHTMKKNAYKIFKNIEDACKNKQITKEEYDEDMKLINKAIKKICEEKSRKFYCLKTKKCLQTIKKID